VERKEWVLVKHHIGPTGLTAAAHRAKQLGAMALDKAASVRAGKDGDKLEPDANKSGDNA
jgi:hypothetical protein